MGSVRSLVSEHRSRPASRAAECSTAKMPVAGRLCARFQGFQGWSPAGPGGRLDTDSRLFAKLLDSPSLTKTDQCRLREARSRLEGSSPPTGHRRRRGHPSPRGPPDPAQFGSTAGLSSSGRPNPASGCFVASGAALGAPPGPLEDEPPVPRLDPPNELGPAVCQEPFHIPARMPAQAVLDRREFCDRVELRLEVIIGRTSLVCHAENLSPARLQSRHREPVRAARTMQPANGSERRDRLRHAASVH